MQNTPVFLFDMDGTLLDLNFDNQFWFEWLMQEWADRQGASLQTAKTFWLPILNEHKGTLRWYDIPYWSSRFGIDLYQLMQKNKAAIRLKPTVQDVLDTLQQKKIRMWLVTNAHTQGLDIKLAQTGITHYFEHIISSDVVGHAKESTHFWQYLTQHYALDPKQAILIDDNEQVLDAAHTFGIGTLYSIQQPDTTQPPRSTDGKYHQLVQLNDVLEHEAAHVNTPLQSPTDASEAQSGFFSRMRAGLSKTRKNFTEGILNVLVGGKEIDDELLEEVETQLLVADIGVDATKTIIKNLTERTARKELIYANALYKALQEELIAILDPMVKPLHIDTTHQPFVLLVVGVNGVGKTTTIGKLAKRFQQEGKTVMLAAGDTFRAAATEQLKIWGERNGINVVAQGHGADSASVIFDAFESAKAKGVDILIADTAGRLHTKSNLMEELKKVKRVMQKIDASAPHEIMLVVDAGTGQNAINQVTEFNQAVGLTGLTITKLDGSAKGGVVFNIANRTGVPIRYIGVGEGIDDLREFSATHFVEALFKED